METFSNKLTRFKRPRPRKITKQNKKEKQRKKRKQQINKQKKKQNKQKSVTYRPETLRFLEKSIN